jgi:hypothetical protein
VATYNVTIVEQRKVDGITAAREAYNADIPIDSPGPFPTNDEYVQFVMDRAAESYANQYGL